MIKLIALCAALLAGFGLNARVTAVIFDCDGVLVDTEKLKFEAWREVLKPTIDLTEAEYLPLVGNSNELVLEALGKAHHVKLKTELIAAREASYARRQAAGVPQLARGVALVHYLKTHQRELNLKLGLASGGMKTEILENLKQTQLDHSFDRILSGTDDLKDVRDPAGTNKPKPYIYQKMARQLGVEPKDVVVFEDSGPGVAAAANAGMTVYAVPNAFTKTQDFSRARAVLALEEPAEATIKRVLSAP